MLHVDPIAFYLERLGKLAERLTTPQYTTEKLLEEDVRSRLSMPLLQWQTSTYQRLILSNGDYVDREKYCGLKLFGMQFFCSERIAVIKKYCPITIKKTFMWTIELYDLDELDIISDIEQLEQLQMFMHWLDVKTSPDNKYLGLEKFRQVFGIKESPEELRSRA